MQAYLFVFIGGGLGSVCRLAIAQLLREQSMYFPWATFGANALSCIVLGALMGWSIKHGFNDSTRIFLMAGFCGGFSTFSTFTYETYELLVSGNSAYALANVALSLLVCLSCFFLGLKLI